MRFVTAIAVSVMSVALGCGDLVVGDDGTGGNGGSGGTGGVSGSGGGGSGGTGGADACTAALQGSAVAPSGGIVQLAAGDQHACAVFASGSVYCWGDNRLGQIGDGTEDNVRPEPVAVAGLSDAFDVAAGVERSCALRGDGDAVCWGMLAHYGFDLFDPVSSVMPKCRSGMSDGATLSGRSYHYCATRAGGEVACWGQNDHGQLGQLGDEWFRHPTAVAGVTGAVKTATGYSHSCALLGSGQIVCWGNNEFGELGADLPMTGATPDASPVVGIDDAVDLVAGSDHTCAVRSDGTVWCWGREHALGSAMDDDSPIPLQVPGLSAVVELAAGDDRTCARHDDATVSCWGHQMEDPTVVAGLTNVTQLAAGRDFVCALSGGEVHCWGENAAGQLGDGTLFARDTLGDAVVFAP